MGLRFSVELKRCARKAASGEAAWRREPLSRFVSWIASRWLCGKGVPGQATARPLRGRHCTPTSLALQAAPALASRPLARRSRSTGSPASGLACSVLQPAAELASLTAFAALRQWRRVSLRSALARAAASPGLAGRAGPGGPAVRKAQAVPRTACVPAHLLGAPQGRRGLSGHAFAGCLVVCDEREEPSRRAVPTGGDLWSDEDHRPGVGARSAQRRLTRRNCLSAVSEANAASSATRPLAENRSAVGAQRRPRKHEPPVGTAWRDAEALPNCAGSRTPIKQLVRGSSWRCYPQHVSLAARRGRN